MGSLYQNIQIFLSVTFCVLMMIIISYNIYTDYYDKLLITIYPDQKQLFNKTVYQT